MPAAPDPDPNATSGGDAAGRLLAPPPLAARYALGDEIARGGMGAVYRATDTTLGREVAVKALQERFAPDSGTARRFADEARIAAQLQHPGIPPIHDYGTLPDGRPFLAMKLIKGDTLDDLLKARPDPAADRGRFVAAFESVCQAVAYAHANGVIHRDLKPANVMVGKFGEVQVMDWGLAKVLLARSPGADTDPDATTGGTEVRSLRDSDDQHTQAGSVLGTPAYMPSEQAVGAVAKIDARSDVFGLGAVLAVVLTGKPPFTGTTAETTRVKAATGDVADCLTRLDGCGAEPELVALCKRCLSARPADRPADAGEVAAAVAAFRAQAEARARQAELDRATAEATAAEQRKRRRVQAALGLAFTTLVAVGLMFAGWVREQQREAAEQARSAADQADREAAEAVAAVTARYAEAKAAGRDLARWAEAGAAARQARDRAAAAAPEVRDRVGRLAAEVEQEVKNRRLVAAVLDIQASMGDELVNGLEQDYRTADARYLKAFADYGADLTRLPPAEGAAVVRGLGSSSVIELAAAIDDWAFIRSTEASGRAGWKEPLVDPLVHVTRALDPDPTRTRVRDAILARDHAALSKLADEIDPAAHPPQTINLMSVWMLRLRYFAVPQDEAAADSVRFLRRAYPHHPDNFQLAHNLAHFLLWHGSNHAEARSCAAAAVALRPTSSAAWTVVARSAEGLGNSADAAAAYERAAALSPRAWRLSYRAGAHWERAGRPVAAVAAFRAAADRLAHAPTFEAALTKQTSEIDRSELGELAKRLKAHKLTDLVAARLRPGLDRAPHDPAAVREFGAFLELAGDRPAAVALYDRWARADPKNLAAHQRLAEALRQNGDPDAAEAAVRRAVAADPEGAAARALLGEFLKQRGKTDEAVGAYREAVRLDPGRVAYRSALGIVFNDAGRVPEALAEFRELARREPHDALWHDWVAFLLLRAGDGPGARASAREAVRLDPASAQARCNLGRAEWLTGDLGAARDVLGEAVRLDPRHVTAQTRLGEVTRRLGRHDEAAAAFQAVLAVQQTNGYAREQLDYCQRVLRGEVPTAPPPRPAVRP